MKDSELTILKLGGSVITDKSKELHARMDVISRLAKETAEADATNLIVIHGGGSFGHPSAQRYHVAEGIADETRKVGFSETHHLMTILNGIFMDALLWLSFPAVSIMPSSCIVARNGRIESFEDKPIRLLLKTGFVPVLYGDAVVDSELGFTIVSGDQLAAVIARRLQARRVIMGVDVDGLYDDDPKNNENAKFLKHLTLGQLRNLHNRLERADECDVTGGMFGKIAELLPAIEQGISAVIVNAAKPTYIYKVLEGKKVKATFIEKE